MEFITNKSIIKKVLIVIIFIFIFNFTVPNYSQASIGGDLFKPISQFVCGIGDLIIKSLQKIFLGDSTISNSGTKASDVEYNIYYSPYNIFAGNIPAFDINFINPKTRETKMVIYGVTRKTTSLLDVLENENAELVEEDEYTGKLFVTKNGLIRKYKRIYGYEEELEIPEEEYEGLSFAESTVETHLTYIDHSSISQYIDIAWYNEQDNYIYILLDYYYSDFNFYSIGKVMVFKAKCIPNSLPQSLTLETKDINVEIAKKSSAEILQGVISTWYKALRIIALAGLLSILIYIGIRMVLSSTGADQAKYKKMFIDWIVAICLIFVLQYIMIFIMEITNKITEILAGNSAIGLLEPDGLMGNVRKNIAQDVDFQESFVDLIMYVVLVIYTLVFTVMYLKRVIYMAFLTMISPLIALTYPLDKIKDGQAQAFSMWLKEYIFNALLQVVHLLLYIILVKSASDLVNVHPIYGLVAIGFLVPGEKLFRKMFGFEKAETTSKFGAATGGAALMSLMNKLKSKATSNALSGGDASGKGNGGIKMNDRTPGGKDKTDSSTSEWAKRSDTPEGKAGEATGEAAGGATGELAGKSTGAAAGAATGAVVGTVVPGAGNAIGAEEGAKIGEKMGGEVGKQTGKKVGGTIGKSVGNAVGQTRRKVTNKIKNTVKNKGKSAIRGAKAYVHKRFTKRKVLKYLGTKALQLGAGAALGTIGLAAGIATGDFNNAGKYALGGIAAGGTLGKGVANKAERGYDKLGENIDLYKQGSLGTEYEQYKNEKLDKEFLNDPEVEKYFMANFENYKQAMKDALIVRQNQIADKEKITKILNMAYKREQNGSKEERISNIKKMINISQLNDAISDKQYNNEEARRNFKETVKKKLMKQNVNSKQAEKNSNEIMKLLGEFKNNDLY